MTNKRDEDSVWPPPPTDGNKVPHRKESFSWSASTILVGILAGGTIYAILYLFSTLLLLKLGINIADHHQSWILLNRLLGGTIWTLPIVNLLWLVLIFYRTRKRSISFAVGVLTGGLAVMVIVLKIVADLRQAFPMS